MKNVELPCYFASLRRAERAIGQIYDGALRPLGIKTTQFTVLQLLSRVGQARNRDLVEALVADQTTLTRNLALMESRGWIAGMTGADRRERYWTLTDPGRALLDQATPQWQEAQRRLERELGKGAVETLKAQLNELSRLPSR